VTSELSSHDAALLDLARRAAAAGGEVIRRYFHEGVAMRSKTEAEPGAAEGGEQLGTFNLVSDADVEAEQRIGEVLRREVPDHALLGEESLQGPIDAEHLWVIDPLDGTNNFAHQIPHFAVSIGYYHRGEARVGVIYNPIREEWYWAVRGGGAWFNDRRQRVSPARELTEVLIGCGFYYDRGVMMRATLEAIAELFQRHVHGIRRFGTASLDLVQVGGGQFGGYFEYQLSPWDFAAGRLFVEEAGGRITDARGGPLPLAASSVLASNGHLHEAILEVTARHHL
jgi:myo-inositol-1(or 4)-monophosphatase